MEATVIGFNTGSRRSRRPAPPTPDAVIDALIGVSVPNLTGGFSTIMPNHHITKPVYIGEIQDDGQFDVVWQTPGLVVGDEWSDYLPDSKDLISDWRAPMSCRPFDVSARASAGTGPDSQTVSLMYATTRGVSGLPHRLVFDGHWSMS